MVASAHAIISDLYSGLPLLRNNFGTSCLYCFHELDQSVLTKVDVADHAEELALLSWCVVCHPSLCSETCCYGCGARRHGIRLDVLLGMVIEAYLLSECYCSYALEDRQEQMG